MQRRTGRSCNLQGMLLGRGQPPSDWHENLKLVKKRRAPASSAVCSPQQTMRRGDGRRVKKEVVDLSEADPPARPTLSAPARAGGGAKAATTKSPL